jgi:DNA-binding response OmpR family regulator
VNILVVEDDVRLASVVKRGLAKNGHVVDVVNDGRSGEQFAQESRYDAIVLDVVLPDLDGLAITRRLRGKGIRTPILMLTARDTVEDTIAGLDAGANDYLRKPFVFAELDARLRAIARSTARATANVLRVADVTLDLETRRVERSGRTIELTLRETAFLEYFMRHACQIVTRAMLENALWEHGRYVESNIAEVYVYRLRSKLRIDGLPPLISTCRGFGYRFA